MGLCSSFKGPLALLEVLREFRARGRRWVLRICWKMNAELFSVLAKTALSRLRPVLAYQICVYI